MNTDIRPASILLIEDEYDLREDIAEELKAAGYSVNCCDHGEQALQALALQRTDLILCDISMPIMDGYTFLETLREQRPDLADIPFVFLTAQAAPGQMAQGKRAGADDYLVKPIDFDLMLATIDARLRQVYRLKHRNHDKGFTASSSGFDSIRSMLDSLAINLLMFTAEEKISFLNKMATASLNLKTGQSLSDFLKVCAIRETGLLRRTIQQVISSQEETTHCLALTTAGEAQQNLLATVCSLETRESTHPFSEASLAGIAPRVSIMITSLPRQRPEPPVELLQTLYELTPAEARVAWAFTQGHRSDEIAAMFQISPATVAFHKRNIFLKTQTNRQADLIALLLSLPVV